MKRFSWLIGLYGAVGVVIGVTLLITERAPAQPCRIFATVGAAMVLVSAIIDGIEEDAHA
jgi:NhaP-type Na+/H+ and K+/H+ antiporter